MSSYAHRNLPNIIPVGIAVPPAAIVTALLVLLMHTLIATDEPPIIDDPPIVAELVRPKDDPIIFEENEPPVKPDDAAPPPVWVQPQASLSPEDGEITWENPTPQAGGKDDLKVGTGGGGIVAYLKPQPMYPSRPLSRGIEGYVDLAFDITPTGATTNIRVIASVPQGVFDRAAISALKKWKYKVPEIDGVAQGQADMSTRMTFNLDD